MRKRDFGAFVNHLAASCELFVPLDVGGMTLFSAIDSSDTCNGLGLENTTALPKRPLKELFFPQEEVLFAFDAGGGIETTEDTSAQPGGGVSPSGVVRVALGVRPCDARSLTILDLVFDAADYKDPYYVSRRRRTALVTFACSEPGMACFCTSVGGGPFDETGSDVVCADGGEEYVMWPLSAAGEGLLEGFAALREAGEEELEAVRKARAAAEARLAGNSVPVEKAVSKLGGAFDRPEWDDVHRKCLGCAACTYLCPTCHCFDIGDEATRTGGERVRNWDSCMFPLFTLHASGHNPRPSRKERFRQRIMHKFNYFVENHGTAACVGCGRCVENCPVNLDVRKVLEVFAAL
ncbi:MAG: 4Fe-4S dicluster domain-containing protein [Firmicutes bacterium]|nr:4Fe-4S dicluster domain-containing protein [Bacillota bacterium]MDH7494633.1 4Fe-4S dicluster domain-containing protein [Bacillota bacterium]